MDSQPYKSAFLEEVRQIMRTQHYAIRTEYSYIDWIKRFILFHNKQHPKEMGEPEVAAFLTHLSVNRNVAPATQRQALNARDRSLSASMVRVIFSRYSTVTGSCP